jgi:hypothetical protein
MKFKCDLNLKAFMQFFVNNNAQKESYTKPMEYD